MCCVYQRLFFGEQPFFLLFPAIIKTQSDNFSSLFFRCAISACILPPLLSRSASPSSRPLSKLNTPGDAALLRLRTPPPHSTFPAKFCRRHLHNYNHSFTMQKKQSSDDISSCLLKALTLNRNPQGDSLLKGNAIFLHPLLYGAGGRQ